MDVEKILALEPMIDDPNFRHMVEELRSILAEEPAPVKRKRKRKEDK